MNTELYRPALCKTYYPRDDKVCKCKRGDNCRYSHGYAPSPAASMSSYSELLFHPCNFRTRLCEDYKNGVECRSGKYCCFAHGEDDLRKGSVIENPPQTDSISPGMPSRPRPCVVEPLPDIGLYPRQPAGGFIHANAHSSCSPITQEDSLSPLPKTDTFRSEQGYVAAHKYYGQGGYGKDWAAYAKGSLYPAGRKAELDTMAYGFHPPFVQTPPPTAHGMMPPQQPPAIKRSFSSTSQKGGSVPYRNPGIVTSKAGLQGRAAYYSNSPVGTPTSASYSGTFKTDLPPHNYAVSGYTAYEPVRPSISPSPEVFHNYPEDAYGAYNPYGSHTPVSQGGEPFEFSPAVGYLHASESRTSIDSTNYPLQGEGYNYYPQPIISHSSYYSFSEYPPGRSENTSSISGAPIRTASAASFNHFNMDPISSFDEYASFVPQDPDDLGSFDKDRQFAQEFPSHFTPTHEDDPYVFEPPFAGSGSSSRTSTYYTFSNPGVGITTHSSMYGGGAGFGRYGALGSGAGMAGDGEYAGFVSPLRRTVSQPQEDLCALSVNDSEAVYNDVGPANEVGLGGLSVFESNALSPTAEKESLSPVSNIAEWLSEDEGPQDDLHL